MKRLKLITMAFILLSAAVIASLPARAETVYFAVVNNKVYPFDTSYRPYISSGRTTMIPHVILTNEGFSGYNGLGLRSQWSPEENYFTIYNSSTQLTFVHKQNTAFSGSERFTATMHLADDVFIIPADLVCQVFGFVLDTTATDWGTMVRIRSGGLDNDQFVTTYGSTYIKREYDAYMASLPSPAPVPSYPLRPSASPASPSPSPVELYDISVYLTFDGAVNDSTARLLDFLERERLHALFFLPPESLADDPAVIRRIAARQQIGLLLDEPDGEALADAARHGNDLLREAAFIKTWLLRADNAPSDSLEYRYWGYSRRFDESDSVQDIVSDVTPRLKKTLDPADAVLVLSLPHSDAALDALVKLLPLMGKEHIWRVSPGELPIK